MNSTSYLKLLACITVSFCAISTAHAAPPTTGCYGAANSNECQFQLTTLSEAPMPSVSKGLKLNAGITSVLFRSYPLFMPPYFVSNTTLKDVFVPQGTQPELTAFFDLISAPTTTNMPTLDYAVQPAAYNAVPGTFPECPFTGSQNLLLPFGTVAPPQPIVNRFTLYPAHPTPQFNGLATQTDIQFYFSRNDCSVDNQGNKLCNTVNFRDNENLTFKTTGTAPALGWNTASPIIIPTLTRSVNGGPMESVLTCAAVTPKIGGSCGSNDGKNLKSSPTDNLCATGNATLVQTFNTEYGLKWGWSCNDVQGTLSNPSATAPTGPGCAACQDMAKKVETACSASCGGGTKNYTWYDGCGRVEAQGTEACNTQACVPLVPGLCVDKIKNKLDVLFLADTTGSMGPVQVAVRQTAQQTLQAIAALSTGGPNPIDLRTAVANYDGDPGENLGDTYHLIQGLSSSTATTLSSMNSWYVGDGHDEPEGAMFALANLATLSSVGWRQDANHVIVWIGDNPSHEFRFTRQQVGNILKANDIHPLAFSVRHALYGYMTKGLDGLSYGYYCPSYCQYYTDTVSAGQASVVASIAHGISVDTPDMSQINPKTVAYINSLINTKCQ